MRKVIQIVLGLVIVALAYIAVEQVMTPLRFQSQTKIREAAVIDRIKDIRAAERAFKQKNQRYTGSFDTLINFVLTESLEFERKIVDEDDSVAMAKLKLAKKANVEKFTIPVIDTIFGSKKLSVQDVKNLRYVPFAPEGSEYILNAGMFTTESKVVVPVFECKAPFKMFLGDLNRQELINLIDETKNVYEKYPGIKVGALDAATNDAGNWE